MRHDKTAPARVDGSCCQLSQNMRQLILAGTVAFFATVHFSVVADNTTTHSNVHFLHFAFAGRTET